MQLTFVLSKGGETMQNETMQNETIEKQTEKQVWKTPQIIEIRLDETKSGGVPGPTENATFTS